MNADTLLPCGLPGGRRATIGQPQMVVGRPRPSAAAVGVRPRFARPAFSRLGYRPTQASGEGSA